MIEENSIQNILIITLVTIFLSACASPSQKNGISSNRFNQISSEQASKESVKSLILKTDGVTISDQIIDKFYTRMKKQFPDAPDSYWNDLSKEFNTNYILDLFIPIYQKHLSEKDIKNISLFYDTETGKKLIKYYPIIMQEFSTVSQKKAREFAMKAYEKYKSFSEALSKEVKMLNKELPKMINANIRFDRISLKGKHWLYNYTLINQTKEDLEISNFSSDMTQKIKNAQCNNSKIQYALNNNGSFTFSYQDRDKTPIVDIVINKSNCL